MLIRTLVVLFLFAALN